VARAVWRPDPSFHTSAECWLTAGAPHHTCMLTVPDARELFVDYAEMVGTELAIIEPGTTVESFAEKLRWNQAYYRLAQGF
jgi:L-arabinose isomerase